MRFAAARRNTLASRQRWPGRPSLTSTLTAHCAAWYVTYPGSYTVSLTVDFQFSTPAEVQVPVHRGKAYGGKVLHNLKDTLKARRGSYAVFSFLDVNMNTVRRCAFVQTLQLQLKGVADFESIQAVQYLSVQVHTPVLACLCCSFFAMMQHHLVLCRSMLCRKAF